MINLDRLAKRPWLRWLRALATPAAALLAPAAAMPPAEATIDDRLSALRSTLHDAGATFSAAWMLEQLHELEPGLTQASPVTRCQWHTSLQLLHSKRGDWDALVEHGEAALALDESTSCLSPYERVHVLDMLQKTYTEQGETERAIATVRMAMDAAPAAGLSISQRLGMQQQLGYLLHEAGQVRQALEQNLKTRDEGIAYFGDSDPRLVPLLINIAQNHYELGDRLATRAVLDATLRLIKRSPASDYLADNPQFLVDILFQLGVLCFEDGRSDEAQQFFLESLTAARRSGDAYLIEQAEERVQELQKRVQELHRYRSKPWRAPG